MSPADVIGARAPGGWTPSVRLQSLWRSAGAGQALPPRLIFADRAGKPTPVFLGVFSKAFGAGLRPEETIITRAGRPTQGFIDATRGLGL